MDQNACGRTSPPAEGGTARRGVRMELALLDMATYMHAQSDKGHGCCGLKLNGTGLLLAIAPHVGGLERTRMHKWWPSKDLQGRPMTRISVATEARASEFPLNCIGKCVRSALSRPPGPRFWRMQDGAQHSSPTDQCWRRTRWTSGSSHSWTMTNTEFSNKHEAERTQVRLAHCQSVRELHGQ